MPLRVGEVVVTGLPPTDAFPGELFKFLMEGNGGELALHAHDLHPLAVGFQMLHLGIDIALDAGFLDSGWHKTRPYDFGGFLAVAFGILNFGGFLKGICLVSGGHKTRPYDFGGG